MVIITLGIAHTVIMDIVVIILITLIILILIIIHHTIAVITTVVDQSTDTRKIAAEVLIEDQTTGLMDVLHLRDKLQVEVQGVVIIVTPPPHQEALYLLKQDQVEGAIIEVLPLIIQIKATIIEVPNVLQTIIIIATEAQDVLQEKATAVEEALAVDAVVLEAAEALEVELEVEEEDNLFFYLI